MHCDYCEWKCDLGPEKFGRCRMYAEEDGAVRERYPNRWCIYGVSRIESFPFYHAYPGSRSLLTGTAGCNLDCRYCSNAYVAKEDPASLQDVMLDMTPEELVGMAGKMGCHNIVFSVNEPTVSLPTLGNLSRAAKAAGIPMGCLTNGYATEGATELLADIFSFFNVSLKGLSPDFCRKYLGTRDSEPVVRFIRRLARDRHVEVTTPVIESGNDQELDRMADILADIDPEIPWHVFRLLPEHKMNGANYQNVAAINAGLEHSRQRLPYLYLHNFIGSEWVNTVCPACGETVIERFSMGCGGDKLSANRCRENACPGCGRSIRLWGGAVAWNAKEGTA